MTDKSPYAAAAGARSTWHMHVGCQTLATDLGSAFIADRFRQACADLGIDFDNPPAGIPILRGKIERIFRTIDLKLLGFLAGRTFENVVARGETDPADLTCLSIEQLATILVLYVVDIYHNEGHEGLAGETPAHAFKRLSKQFGTELPPDEEKRRLAFGVRIKRTISKCGVRVLNLFYNSPALAEYYRQVGDKNEVEVIMSAHDLGAVYVVIPHLGGHIDVLCSTPQLKGVNAITWIATLRDLKRRYARQAIPAEAVALEALKQIIATGEAARLAANIATQALTPELIDRLENSIQIPWRSREVVRANPDAGGDFLTAIIPSTATGDYQPPAAPSPTQSRQPPRTRLDDPPHNPETGEIDPPTPDTEGNSLPDGWTIDD